MSDVLDETLFEILKECKTLPNFLDHIFGFLRRRTDFYVTAEDINSPVGLPPGLAERVVKESFYKYKLCNNSTIEDVVPKTIASSTNEDEVPKTIASEEVVTTSNKTTTQEHLSKEFSISESYNGAVYDNYTWSQSISEVDVIVKVPEQVTIKNLSVVIHPTKISVKVKDTDEVLLEGEFCGKCKNDPIWSLDGTKLEIHLDKATEMWWNCLVLSEPKLDISKFDCSRPFEELPEEAQSKIEELAWNEERRRQGLPTSDEISMQGKLKKAWNCEGSPFKGRPYDPNTVIFN